jgi:mannosyltransferase
VNAVRPDNWFAVRPPHARLLVLLALFALALALRLFRLEAQSLWLDEGGSWAEVTGRTGKGWLALLAELWSPNAGYPLYHLLLKAWVALAGDGEWALRFPSAVAGAAAAVVIYLAACESGGERRTAKGKHGDAFCLLPFAFVMLSPFALWHAQDAKAYSLLLFVSALVLWLLLRVLRTETRREWLALLAVVLVSLFVHRLALLGAAGVALCLALTRSAPEEGNERRGEKETHARSASLLLLFSSSRFLLLTAIASGALGVYGTLLAARGEAAGVERANVGPLAALGLVLARFSLDRWPGDVDGFLGLPAALWLAPFAVLTVWGLALLTRDARCRQPVAVALLCMLLVPLGLYALTLAIAPVFQARYAVPAFPAWVLVVCYPLLRRSRTENREPRTKNQEPVLGSWFLVLTIVVSVLLLFQPGKGLFSGAPVKEQWREAVRELALRVHPADLVVVHPYYVLPMWDYYASRVTPDPLPQPATFPIFAEGDTGGAVTRAELLEHVRKRYEPFFDQQATGKSRALLLIAPDHAATVDPPKTLAELTAEWEGRGGPPVERPTEGDSYGWVGLRFEFPQRTWPCGGAEFLGVALMCQSFPETFNPAGPGTIPEPQTTLPALFGGELRLRGYTVSPHGGVLRPGGTLPITLFWEAAVPPTRRYRMFVHLCRDCESPPLAGADGPPLFGYPPAGDTTTWRVGDPVHDERTLALPADLPPGRYTLLMGVYPEGEPTIEARLAVVAASGVLANGRLVLGEIEVGHPDR